MEDPFSLSITPFTLCSTKVVPFVKFLVLAI